MKKIVMLLATMVLVSAIAIGASATSAITLTPRDFSADVVGDWNGILIIQDGPSPYDFLQYKADGTFEIEISDDTLPNDIFAPWANGLNPKAEYYFDDILVIHNAGEENYNVTISSNKARVQFYTMDDQWFSQPTVAQSLTVNNLPPGWNLVFGVYINALDKAEGSEINAKITITAENAPSGP
jgi:hypothetical protein